MLSLVLSLVRSLVLALVLVLVLAAQQHSYQAVSLRCSSCSRTVAGEGLTAPRGPTSDVLPTGVPRPPRPAAVVNEPPLGSFPARMAATLVVTRMA